MSKADRTKAYIIEQVAPVFNKKGYASASLSDITAATGLTKGAIYGNFADKNDVSIEAFRHNVRQLDAELNEWLLRYDQPLDRLMAVFDYYRHHCESIFERGGCPILNAAVEADDHLHFMQPSVRGSIKGLVQTFSRLIREGQQQRAVVAGADAEQYAYTFIALLEGGIMLAKAMDDKALLYTALERIEQIIIEELKLN